MIIKLFFIVIFNFIFAINVVESDTTKKIINHDWKLNVFSIGKGMIPIGQFENNKPFKAFVINEYEVLLVKRISISKRYF